MSATSWTLSLSQPLLPWISGRANEYRSSRSWTGLSFSRYAKDNCKSNISYTSLLDGGVYRNVQLSEEMVLYAEELDRSNAE